MKRALSPPSQSSPPTQQQSQISYAARKPFTGPGHGLNITVKLHAQGITDVECDKNPGINEMILKPLGFTWESHLKVWRCVSARHTHGMALAPHHHVTTKHVHAFSFFALPLGGHWFVW